MTIESISASTLDDLLHDTYSALRTRGANISTSRGHTSEIAAVVLELTNPLARLSRSEARGLIFSCLGELCWYLAADDSLEMIRYYIPAYEEEAVDGKVLGAYGPRLFGAPPNNQVTTIQRLLTARETSRRAVLQLYDAADLLHTRGDVPCTCTVQFLSRQGALDTIVYMRSNDAVRGLPHDVFCFTMLQELLAKSLGLTLGRYCHMVGSLHLYTVDQEKVTRFLDEGFQSTKSPMPPMPDGDPWPVVEKFLQVEAAIRVGQDIPYEAWAALPAYWQNLGQLLKAFGMHRARETGKIAEVSANLEGTVYAPFLTGLLSR